MTRWLVAAAATLSAMGWVAPAFAATEAGSAVEASAASLAPNAYVWSEAAAAPAASREPISVVVSIADQRAYVYRGQVLIAASSVSTGKEGKDTPVGSYTILQKQTMHKSNLYDSAPMPYMQRLTWDGIAIHAGKNPGFPDSHGCIRVPTAFAAKLFAITTVGTTVEVTDMPVDADAPPSGDDLVPADVRAEAEAAKANQSQLASIDR